MIQPQLFKIAYLSHCTISGKDAQLNFLDEVTRLTKILSSDLSSIQMIAANKKKNVIICLTFFASRYYIGEAASRPALPARALKVTGKYRFLKFIHEKEPGMPAKQEISFWKIYLNRLQMTTCCFS